jgi:glycerophosphoryl diester phosphodiesterase
LLWHEDMPDNWKELADYLDTATINISDQLATRDFIEEIIEFGRQVLVYTINDHQRARVLQSWGVDGFFTDVPDIIEDALLKPVRGTA